MQYFEDRPYPRFGRLAPAANLQFDDAAGSIASTPGDMTLYMQMLLNRGQGPTTRIVTADSFALMSKQWIKATEFGPTASYGYGIAVDTLDGHTILRHTGGMASFMSAMNLDLDAGVGAFSSINAQQGYRPTPVAQYAVQLMGASAANKPAPAAPVIEDPKVIKNSADYVGVVFLARRQDHRDHWRQRTGRDCGGPTISLATLRRRLVHRYRSAAHSLFLVWSGEERKRAKEKAKPGPVVELMHGSGWYTNAKYIGPKSFAVPPEYAALTGTYLGAGAFEGSSVPTSSC